MQATRLLFIHALAPLHAGTGQGVGVIDLPIAREKGTGFPYIPGSSIKGVLRDNCQAHDSNNTVAIFGPEKDNASDHAGSIQFSDQRLLLLPIRSLFGTFAWVTCPMILRRLARDVKDAGGAAPASIPELRGDDACACVEKSALVSQQKVYLEDLDLNASSSKPTQEWAAWIARAVFADSEEWQTMLERRFCIVNDDLFAFLQNTATEVTARIRLAADSRTVEQGGLWYEEALPAESILSGLCIANPVKKVEKDMGITAAVAIARLEHLVDRVMQVGGKATVGRGLCRMRLVHPSSKAAGGAK